MNAYSPKCGQARSHAHAAAWRASLREAAAIRYRVLLADAVAAQRRARAPALSPRAQKALARAAKRTRR